MPLPMSFFFNGDDEAEMGEVAPPRWLSMQGGQAWGEKLEGPVPHLPKACSPPSSLPAPGRLMDALRIQFSISTSNFGVLIGMKGWQVLPKSIHKTPCVLEQGVLGICFLWLLISGTMQTAYKSVLPLHSFGQELCRFILLAC